MRPLKALISKSTLNRAHVSDRPKPNKFSELKFGDVVLVYENGDIISDNKEGGVNTYIYLPKATGDIILKNEGSFDDVEDDIFIMWVPRNVSEYNVSYWNATDFKVYFPLHQIYQSNCKIEYIVDHYDNYKNIKNAKDLKVALKKYN